MKTVLKGGSAQKGFNINVQTLTTPWRWNQQGVVGLGVSLAQIRTLLLNRSPINLNEFHQHINVIIDTENNFLVAKSVSKQKILDELKDINNDSLLIIHPTSTSIHPRIKFIQHFGGVRLIESIDDKDYYKFSSYFDNCLGQNLIDRILEFAKLISSKTVINTWFNENGILKKKRHPEGEVIYTKLKDIVDLILYNKSFKNIAVLIYELLMLPNNKCFRIDFKKDMIKALELAQIEGISVYEAMKKNRNILRRVGRSVKGKCIGTTLLTKGLEFDTVILLNAHLFSNPKHLYVALTRARKKLIILTKSPVLNPY